jgi:NAD-dependent deacetylase
MYLARPTYGNPEKKIIILTGAGISAESGIQTFRDSDGLWENNSVEEICNESTWKKNFKQVHGFYNDRRKELEGKEPNKIHITIAKIKDKYKDDCIVITQNVDNLFEKAGLTELMHVHGYLEEMKCENCGIKWNIGNAIWDISNDRCKCGSSKGVRPNIVLFGGAAPLYSYMNRGFEYLKNPESILIVLGTSGNVIDVDYIMKKYYNRNKISILNNLDKSDAINDKNFTHVLYKKGTEAIEEIEDILYSNF